MRRERVGRLRKLFNAVGVVFKGSGFYRTDSREKQTASTAGSADGKTETKSENKSETKSETKSDSSTSGTKAPASA